uniref:Uncharacterized protein n=1 Tax=virus sp. ctrcb4 TaxID=2825824 RepID=A0A8S5RPG3_9VIRU|nr:MAG TPA: hypothetical protein [virus sp. ctrcb4]DAI39949.1 MAG TPA: hypothetical protein [Caudoviricetes sp.]DAR12702.1 MAG TPA: hypothetical protein [Crassvirales sp.]
MHSLLAQLLDPFQRLIQILLMLLFVQLFPQLVDLKFQ